MKTGGFAQSRLKETCMDKPKDAAAGAVSPVVLVTPVYLKTLIEICSIFGKKAETVKRWRKEGAPIVFDGSNYGADYHSLECWRVKRFR